MVIIISIRYFNFGRIVETIEKVNEYDHTTLNLSLVQNYVDNKNK